MSFLKIFLTNIKKHSSCTSQNQWISWELKKISPCSDSHRIQKRVKRETIKRLKKDPKNIPVSAYGNGRN